MAQHGLTLAAGGRQLYRADHRRRAGHQIPALVVSLAAGLIVTKGGTEGAANEAVLEQLGQFPKALYMASGLLFGIGLLPGFPLADLLRRWPR